jgi:hypothetical protein
LLTLGACGTFAYRPEPNFSGVDSFSYTVSTADGVSNVAVVTLVVEPVNDAPVASNDAYQTAEDEPLVVPQTAGLLANDWDIEAGPLATTIIRPPLHGSLTLEADGSFRYTPEADFSGLDGFSYVVSDGAAASEVAAVTIDVSAVNDAPLAAADAFSLNAGQALDVAAAEGVLANDTDVEGDGLQAVLVTGPAHGVVTLHADGSFTYEPLPGFAGRDAFCYVATDGQAQSEAVTVVLEVMGPSLPPVTVNESYAFEADVPSPVPAERGLLANDRSPSGADLSASLFSGPQHGTLSLAADGSFSYVPEPGFRGLDAFLYRVSDGRRFSHLAAVTIHVAERGPVPLATDDDYLAAVDAILAEDWEP